MWMVLFFMSKRLQMGKLSVVRFTNELFPHREQPEFFLICKRKDLKQNCPFTSLGIFEAQKVKILL